MHPTCNNYRGYLRAGLALIGVIAFLGSTSCSLLGDDSSLVVWEHESGDMSKAFDALLSQFMEAHPNVEVFQAHFKSAEQLRTSFLKSLGGKDAPSVILEGNDFAGTRNISSELSPVDSIFTTTNFLPMVVQSVTDAKGILWGAPLTAGNHLMLFVNRRLVQKAPETVDEMLRIARQWGDPRFDRFGLAYNYWDPFFFMPLLGAFGWHPMENGRPMTDGPGVRDAMRYLTNLSRERSVLACDADRAHYLFMQGKVPMIVDGDWSVNYFESQLKKDLIIAPLPRLDATGRHLASLVSGKYLFVRGKMGSGRSGSAKAFIEFATSKATQEMLARKYKILPARQDVSLSSQPTLAEIRAALMHGQASPPDASMGEVWVALSSSLKTMHDKAAALAQAAPPPPPVAVGRKPASRH